MGGTTGNGAGATEYGAGANVKLVGVYAPCVRRDIGYAALAILRRLQTEGYRAIWLSTDRVSLPEPERAGIDVRAAHRGRLYWMSRCSHLLWLTTPPTALASFLQCSTRPRQGSFVTVERMTPSWFQWLRHMDVVVAPRAYAAAWVHALAIRHPEIRVCPVVDIYDSHFIATKKSQAPHLYLPLCFGHIYHVRRAVFMALEVLLRVVPDLRVTISWDGRATGRTKRWLIDMRQSFAERFQLVELPSPQRREQLLQQATFTLWLNSSDTLGILPSLSLACGTPVIAWNLEIGREIVGDAGLLLEPAGYVSSPNRLLSEIYYGPKHLIGPIQALLSDISAAGTMAERAVQQAQRERTAATAAWDEFNQLFF